MTDSAGALEGRRVASPLPLPPPLPPHPPAVVRLPAVVDGKGEGDDEDDVGVDGESWPADAGRGLARLEPVPPPPSLAGIRFVWGLVGGSGEYRLFGGATARSRRKGPHCKDVPLTPLTW